MRCSLTPELSESLGWRYCNILSARVARGIVSQAHVVTDDFTQVGRSRFEHAQTMHAAIVPGAERIAAGGVF